MERVWILGASDPEMQMIEDLLVKSGEKVAYAVFGGKRVSPPTAYRADGYQFATDCGMVGDESEFILVECDVATPDDSPRRVIDHHREGDPGFGRPPQDFLAASSIGQVVDWLSDVPGSEEIRLCAAADHCLGAAYAGRCPGVDPDALMAWRAASRAAFQGRTVGEILADVEATSEALRKAPIVILGEVFTGPGPHGGVHAEVLDADQWAQIWARDMRREPPYPELPEAATRLGLSYVSGPLVDRDGRRKITVSGDEEVIESFLKTWAPAQGLVNLYGDPARGFAGGYLPE